MQRHSESLVLHRFSTSFSPKTRSIRALSAINNCTFFIHTNSLSAWDSVRMAPHILLSQPCLSCPLTPTASSGVCAPVLWDSQGGNGVISQLGLEMQEALHIGSSPQKSPFFTRNKEDSDHFSRRCLISILISLWPRDYANLLEFILMPLDK